MARYRAKCWLGSSSGYQDLEVSANTRNGANEQLRDIYGAQQIINLHEVREGSSGESSIGSSGSVVLIGLLGLSAVWVYFTPWIMMTVCGAGGTWIAQKLTRTTLEDACDNDNNKAIAIILGAALILGGYGFVQGQVWHRDIMKNPTEQIKTVK
jgi:hypothetical protein